MIDKRLIILERYLENYGQNFTYLSKELNVSLRQLSRVLKQWHSEGYIKYTPGNGRGRGTKIELNLDIERELLFEIYSYRNEISMNEFNNYLELPWHSESIESIRKIIEYEYENSGIDFDSRLMMDYIYKVPETVNPVFSMEYASLVIGMQVYDTLYKSSQECRINNNLLKYDKWEGDELHLFLKSGIQFSDGEALESKHINSVLKILKHESMFKENFQMIGEIKIYSSLHLSIEVKGASFLIKYYLSEPISSIFKYDNEGNMVGTGRYKIEKFNKKSVILSENEYYAFGRPDIKKIYFLTNESRVKNSQQNNSKHTSSFKRYMWNIFILFNPLKNRLSFEQRNFLQHIILSAVYDSKIGENDLYKKTSDLTLEKQVLQPKFDFPIKIMVDELKPYISKEIKKKLSEYEIEIEYIEMDLKNYIETDLKNSDIDMIMMKESYHQSHPWQLIDLLTHCKFKEWYGQFEEMQHFLNLSHDLDKQAADMSQKISKYLDDSVYIVHLFKQYRYMLVPDKLKNVVELDYGVVDYSKIITAK